MLTFLAIVLYSALVLLASIESVILVATAGVAMQHLRAGGVFATIPQQCTPSPLVVYTPSDRKCKGDLDKKWSNSGLQNSFPEPFFYWFRRTAAQRSEPRSFSTHTNEVQSASADRARSHHPNFGAPVKRLPNCC